MMALKNLPDNWEGAEQMKLQMNEGKEKFSQPLWSWDCNFKLDFDGPLLDVSSRFYPPAQHYGPKWDGKAYIDIGGETIVEKAFECETLDELRVCVEAWVEKARAIAVDAIKQNLKELL